MITGALLTDCLMSYPECLLGESYPSAEKQSVYFTTTADWADSLMILIIYLFVMPTWASPFFTVFLHLKKKNFARNLYTINTFFIY